MPPTKKFQKSEIIDVALEIVKEEGYSKLNARNLANKLGCSVQPIFHNFKNMSELSDEVHNKMYEIYKSYVTVSDGEKKAYKKMGIGYIRFAKDYPEYFKEIFMQKTTLAPEEFIMADAMGDAMIKRGQQMTGLTYELQKKFHIKVWIFTHGLACLVATGTINITDEEIGDLLEKTVHEMFIGFKMEESEDEKCN